jgi:hypothetical protein
VTGRGPQADASAAAGEDGDGHLSAAQLKVRLAEELAALARDLGAFQSTLSALLETDSLSARTLRQLQDIDRATQTLDNLHRVATALAAAHPHPVAATDLDAIVTLADLKHRLAGAAAPSDDGAGHDPGEDGIAWL